ncbi:MAG TPA: L-seryl-tRNA(Sec) selenium transferase [Acidimicrobiales bacterium]|nr:L-seryl-tRNA(Sec) selenium transferase [Acidimicrobiales bacterium]
MSDHEAVSGAVQAARPPSVDALARSLEDAGLPHPLLVDIAREAIAAGDPGSARERAVALSRALLQPVINATGVLLHTNLGRAPLGVTRPPSAWNLELGLDTGERGSRQAHCGRLLARLCGAERALVVNNNASAVLLVLAALARGREVLVSRGESVEIGGGFRVPEVMEQSGARLVDVGTTNRTRLADYDRALTRPGADVALILKIHPSNYRVEGFVEDTSVAALAGLAAGQDGLLVVADIGSGLLDAGCPWLPAGPPAWLVGEPAARQTLAAGAAVVTFSGDKLLGGPQAGVIAGRADLVATCASHPLARALRPGGLVLSALQDVLLAYLRRDAGEVVPFWRMAGLRVSDLRRRAEDVAQRGGGTAAPMASLPGAGSLPGTTIPSYGVVVDGDRSAELRHGDPPIIARVRDRCTFLDLRTVDPADDVRLVAALASLPAP